MFQDRSYPTLLLRGLAAAVMVTLVFGASTSTSAFSAYNHGWDGTSDMRTAVDESGTELTVAQRVSRYDSVAPRRTAAVVLSPTEPYGTEATVIREFVRAGGTLVVAEDYGTGGNDLLGNVGAEARFNGTALRDERNAGPSPAFPRAAAAGNHTYSQNVSGLMLNHGTVIDPGNATPLFHSSPFSYLDENGNAELDTSETLRRYPVVTMEQVGDGRVIAISDPSIFLNAMLAESDNQALLDSLATAHAQLLFDVSHATQLPLLIQIRVLLQQSSVAMATAGIVSILAVFWLFTQPTSPAWLNRQPDAVDSPELSTEAIAAGVRSRHPEWDDQRVQRVTDSLMSYRNQSGTDD